MCAMYAMDGRTTASQVRSRLGKMIYRSVEEKRRFVRLFQNTISALLFRLDTPQLTLVLSSEHERHVADLGLDGPQKFDWRVDDHPVRQGLVQHNSRSCRVRRLQHSLNVSCSALEFAIIPPTSLIRTASALDLNDNVVVHADRIQQPSIRQLCMIKIVSNHSFTHNKQLI